MRDAVVYALGVASSPIPIAAVLMILSGPGASVTSTVFAAGWIMGLVIAAVVVALLVTAFGLGNSRPVWIGATELVFGLGFLVAGTRVWLHRASVGSSRARLDAIDSFTPARAAVLGFLLAAANPKVLALSLGPAISVARSGADMLLTCAAVAMFVGIGALGVVTPIVVYVALPTQGALGLRRVRTGIANHEGAVLAALAVAIGAFFLRDGVRLLVS